MIRVLLVEDHLIFAEGLTELLTRTSEFAIAGHARGVAEALNLIPGSEADVLIVDFGLPDGTGVDLVTQLRRAGDMTPALFLSGDDSDESLLAAIEAGACGYLVKTKAAAQVVDAVRRAADGEMLVDPATLLAMLRRRDKILTQTAERREILAALTRREQEILELMVGGVDNRGIAATLSIEYATVRHHVGSVISKLGAHSKLEAVARAMQLRFREG